MSDRNIVRADSFDLQGAEDLVRKRIMEAIGPIFEELDAKRRISSNGHNVAINLADDAVGTLRRCWKGTINSK